jgi:hypothetical protein
MAIHPIPVREISFRDARWKPENGAVTLALKFLSP